jgi:regulator of replication initiation timing
MDLLDAWMNSPGHRANILNSKYEEIGIAVLKGEFEGKTTWLAVQEFGRPASDCIKVDSNLKTQIDSNIAESDNLEEQIKTLKAQLESSSPTTKEAIDLYNQSVQQYNDLIRLYNNKIDVIKQVQNTYNEQVREYNQCLAK